MGRPLSRCRLIRLVVKQVVELDPENAKERRDPDARSAGQAIAAEQTHQAAQGSSAIVGRSDKLDP